MPFNLSIPKVEGALELTVEIGQIVFVLGANGTGKSSLMPHFSNAHRTSARLISAHRQNWFGSEEIDLSPQQVRSTEVQIANFDRSPNSRWRDNWAGTRASMTLYEIIDAQNRHARAIMKAFRADNAQELDELKRIESPIENINHLLRASNLPIQLSISDDAQVIASKQVGPPYSVARLSDGERNALLIAANVLAAKSGSLLLIDEPERHLHRSIISPLLTQLFRKRDDCSFVVSTHDVLLPLDNSNSRTILVRGCSYTGVDVSSWDADLVPSDAEIEDSLKVDILGSRRKILFVEGISNSLDQPFYSLVFPGTSVIAKNNCRDVEHAVKGIRNAANLHWIHAFGIVDNDARSAAEIEELKQEGIHAVPAYSVEAIYYHPEMQRMVAERYAAVIGGDPTQRLAAAQDAALAAIDPNTKDRLAQRVAEKAIRAEVFRQIPGRTEIQNGQQLNIQIDTPAFVARESARLGAALAATDVAAMIARYPVRESQMLTQIARSLGFLGRGQYESAVLRLLADDAGALGFVRGLFGDLWQAIEVPQ